MRWWRARWWTRTRASAQAAWWPTGRVSERQLAAGSGRGRGRGEGGVKNVCPDSVGGKREGQCISSATPRSVTPSSLVPLLPSLPPLTLPAPGISRPCLPPPTAAPPPAPDRRVGGHGPCGCGAVCARGSAHRHQERRAVRGDRDLRRGSRSEEGAEICGGGGSRGGTLRGGETEEGGSGAGGATKAGWLRGVGPPRAMPPASAIRSRPGAEGTTGGAGHQCMLVSAGNGLFWRRVARSVWGACSRDLDLACTFFLATHAGRGCACVRAGGAA